MIQMFHVYKTFGKDLEALVDVDLHIHKGEMVFLAGPNGAGKSTLLRLIFCDELPTSGQILVNGRNIVRMKPRAVPELRRTLGIVFQDFKLLRDRTIEENLALVARVVGMTTLQVQRKVEQLLKLVGLSHKARVVPYKLSNGEQQRVAVARALMNDPVILLADEPTGNLDPELAADVIRLLFEINAQGTTVLVATHNLKLAEEAGCRTVFLKQGRIVEEWQRVNRPAGWAQEKRVWSSTSLP
ncbi:MAG: cell division ATP-binding protein FtsE [bacterium]|uniref:Cell division ATP-binding protein FtsE n=1 Tax=Candidatus Methylomirabilis tolerans TaxID=3123416 RepID=A0AAJ1AI15_9BACT|nr:cell division ATP-binding protein FtsE [Candidatus Methylomirabilis sp.]